MANVVSDSVRLREIDKNEKNKFRFDWLTKTVKLKLGDKETEVIVGDCVKKVDVSGKAICNLCTDFILYGNRGYGAISDHLKTKKHKEKVFEKKANYTLPSNFFFSKQSEAAASSSSMANIPLKQNVPLCDRVSNSEALILGVVAEHSLPFTMAPVLIEVGKALAEDKKALNHLKINRTCASYKMKYGIANTFLQETVNNLKNIFFL